MTTTPAMPEHIWTCQIGGNGELPKGADGPMREAIAAAFKAVTGCDASYCFSGWGHPLPERYRAVVENRLPDPNAIRRECFAVLDTLPDAATAPGGDFPTPQAQPAEVSDAEIYALWVEHCETTEKTTRQLVCDFARAILALRPQSVPMTEWQPLDAARLNTEEFDGAYWLAMKSGEVSVGEYEWRQGWSPHGFNLIDGGRVGPSDVTHTARFTRPVHPSHGITAPAGGEGKHSPRELEALTHIDAWLASQHAAPAGGEGK